MSVRIGWLSPTVLLLALLVATPAQAKDSDGLPTWWEKKYQLNLNKNDGHRDPDRDRLNNRQEYRHKTHPRRQDSDGDGMNDGIEVRFGFDPHRPDADQDKDGDGIKNIDELRESKQPSDNQTTTDPMLQPNPVEQRGLFIVNCGQTERKNLDPIIAPGRPGVIHNHDFFGPKTVADNSTPADLIEQPTSCGLDSDRSAYWMPTLYNYGQAQDGDHLQAYYFISSRSKPFPLGLAMIAGKPSLTVSNPQSASWSCQPSANYGQGALPPCPSGQYILSEIRFPSCWNGRDLDSPDHRSHVAYFDDNDRCPRSHPVELPELVLFRTFNQYQGLLDQASLSSGATGGLHGDFVSGWDQTALTDLINSCRGRNCGVQSQLQGQAAQLSSVEGDKEEHLNARLFCRLSDQRNN